MTVASPRWSRGLTVTPGGPTGQPVRPAGRRPAQALCRSHPAVDAGGLATEPLSRGVDEGRAANLDRDVSAAHRVERPHALADPFRPAAEKAETDPMPERRRERDRGHVALVVFGARRRAKRDEMRAGAQPLPRLDRPEAGEHRALRIEERRALRHEAADEILPRRHHAPE